MYDAEQHEDHAKRYVQTYIGRMFVAFATRTHDYRVVSLGVIIIFGIRNRWQVNRARRAVLDPLVLLSLCLSLAEENSLRSGFVMVEWTLQSTTLDLLFFFNDLIEFCALLLLRRITSKTTVSIS